MGIKEVVARVLETKELLSFQKVLVIADEELRGDFTWTEQVTMVKSDDIYYGLELHKFRDCTCKNIEDILKNCMNTREWIRATYPYLVTDNAEVHQAFKENTDIQVLFWE